MWSPHLHGFQLSEQAMGPDTDTFSWDSLDNLICSGFDDDFTDSVMVKGKRIRYALLPPAKDVPSELFFPPIKRDLGEQIDLTSLKAKYSVRHDYSNELTQRLAALSDLGSRNITSSTMNTTSSYSSITSPLASSTPTFGSSPMPIAPLPSSLMRKLNMMPAPSNVFDPGSSPPNTMGSPKALPSPGLAPNLLSPASEVSAEFPRLPVKSAEEELEETLNRYWGGVEGGRGGSDRQGNEE
jgi:hypothetical protein